jgi:hypothetical protein
MLNYNYKGGNQTKGGFYLKKDEWEIVTVEGKNGVLPGGGECEYLRVPGVLIVPLAVTLGGAFVIFLPFIGFAMLFVMIATKVGKGVTVVAHGFAQKLAQWQPEKLIGLKPRTGGSQHGHPAR